MKDNLGRRLLVVVALLSMCSCGNGEHTPPLNRVRIAMPVSPITYLPVYLARELGFYHEQGLNVQIEDVPGGSKALQAMFGGSVDVCACVYELAIQLNSEGRRVQSFVTMLGRPGLALAVSPSSKRRINQVEELKGSVVGVSSPGSASYLFLNYLLHRHGLTLQDVKVASVSLGAPAVAAFAQGRVDAAVLTGNAITTIQRRFPNVLLLADGRSTEGVKQIYGFSAYPAHDLLAPTEWIHNNGATARKLVSAVMKAMRYMQEHSPEEIRSHMPAQYRAPEIDADLDALRATIPMLSRDGKVTPEEARAVRNVLAVSDEKVRNAHIDLSETYTNAFLPSTSPLEIH